MTQFLTAVVVALFTVGSVALAGEGTSTTTDGTSNARTSITTQKAKKKKKDKKGKKGKKGKKSKGRKKNTYDDGGLGMGGLGDSPAAQPVAPPGQ